MEYNVAFSQVCTRCSDQIRVAGLSSVICHFFVILCMRYFEIFCCQTYFHLSHTTLKVVIPIKWQTPLCPNSSPLCYKHSPVFPNTLPRLITSFLFSTPLRLTFVLLRKNVSLWYMCENVCVYVSLCVYVWGVGSYVLYLLTMKEVCFYIKQVLYKPFGNMWGVILLFKVLTSLKLSTFFKIIIISPWYLYF